MSTTGRAGVRRPTRRIPRVRSLRVLMVLRWRPRTEVEPRTHEVSVTVADSGPGIDAEALPRIFERFYTTRRSRRGTGLGLALVRAIAEAHGGSVRVASPPGSGAVFVLEIPR